MKPAAFDYAAPTSVDEAVALLTEHEDAKVLAGGQSLVPLLSLRLARPRLLVDLNGVSGLGAMTEGVGSVRFGALVRQHELLDPSRHPLVAEAARWIAHAAIRSRGTLGGSLAHADSAAELPVVATALGATIEATGPSGVRSIPADDFFYGLLQTALADDEVLTAVNLPLPRRWGFAELARRQGDFALVLVAAAETSAGWRVAVGGVEGTPRLCTEAGRALDAGDIEGAAQAAAAEVEPIDHLHATATYQRGMTAQLVRQAVSR